jgi:predicted  nucleic acid-binding Zn-ribbon protein
MKEGTIEAQVDAGVTSAFDKFKNIFVPKAAADLEKAQGDLTAANATITQLNAKIVELTGKVTAYESTIAAKDQAIKDLETKLKETEASVTTRANQQALSIEQRRGVSAPLKEEQGKETPGGAEKSKAQEYRELLAKDAVAAGKFYAQHTEEIFASWGSK